MITTPYRRFIAKEEKIWGGMPSRERQILKIILGRKLDCPLRVMGVIEDPQFGSRATAHAALNRLLSSNFLQYKECGQKDRSKFIVLSSKGAGLFKRLEKLFLASA